MSSELGVDFGNEHQDKYAKVLSSWVDKISGGIPSEKQLKQWGADLMKALNEPVIETLLATHGWKEVDLPSDETLQRYSMIAAKYTLQHASPDLLNRLSKSVKADKVVPEAITAAVGFAKPSELISRAGQTLSQVYDMAKDKFNEIMNRRLEQKNELTGRRKWVSSGDNSRHAALDGEVRAEGESFSYRKKSIDGPRPPGGNPKDWSNCSCYLLYETRGGKWIRT